MDCSRAQGNHGCNGGLPSWAFDYIKVKKITNEQEYPYVARDQACKASQTKTRYPLTQYKTLSQSEANVVSLAKQIKIQPVSVGIWAGKDFVDYKSGVYTADPSCGDKLNHGVLAVGYNTNAEVPFFIVKNSWGQNWGMSGYVHMAIGKGRGTCGIANIYDSFPTEI